MKTGKESITVTNQEAERDYLRSPLHRSGEMHCPCELAVHPAGHEPAFNELTDRERQVLILLGGGLPNRALARQLGIAERTVKAHVAHIVGKLGLRTRLEAAVISNVYHNQICPDLHLRDG
ncbi:helix-turn-helix domain-containing protein [Streptomyces montanus]